MCGIAGFLDQTGRAKPDLQRIIQTMTATLVRRGPDDEGVWIDAGHGICLGHRRLSVVDLSPLGSQPMQSDCGRFCIVYNGEVYNHRELRRRLESQGHTFRGNSDTEILLAAIVEWGTTIALERSVGMFAFTLWDRQTQTLLLARDRLGIKPLYYGWAGTSFVFGSELKAMHAHPDFSPTIDRRSLGLYLRNGYVPHPHCIFEDVRQLTPGCLLNVPQSGGRDALQVQRWWNSRSVAVAARDSGRTWDDSQAIDELQAVLSEAVALRMEADVPVGAFLSGGIDSSVVVALMQTQSSKPVKTFSIGFEEAAYDEAAYAKAVAAHLKTDHTEYYVTSQEARDLIPRLPEMYDEPFGDSSQIPTHLVSARARQDVTVCLSGDGGDELFCGYNRYFTLSRLWRRIEWCPTLVRRIITRLIPVPSRPVSRWRIGRRLQLIRKLLDFENGHEAYTWFHAHWREPCDVVQRLDTDQQPMGPDASGLPGDLFEQMAFWDAVSYLPDDILVKVDRASMAVGLEARVPMLDHRVADFAWQLPVGFKVRGGQGKWVLRQLLQRFVPRQLVERPKMGFGVPLDSWLRGPLRDWSEALLDERRLRDEGYFNPAAVRKKWDDHITGKCDWQYLLWDVLMFQAWLEASRGATSGLDHNFVTQARRASERSP